MEIEYVLTLKRREQLYRFYFDEWWTRERPRSDADAALAASFVALIVQDDEVVAFARAVSDGVFFAWVGDVIVAPEHRGTGLGARVMDAITAHPDLQRVRKWDLSCLPEMDAFYERWGFTDPAPSHTRRRQIPASSTPPTDVPPPHPEQSAPTRATE